MTKFCIELEGITMPDAIAAVVEAWYDAQNTLIISKPDSAYDPGVSICDGKMLSELFETLPLSRGSIFEIIKALGIVTTKGPSAGGKGRVAWVSNADGERLFDAAHRVNKGEVRIADLVFQDSDGIRLSEWQLESGLSRSTLYELLKLLKIKPEGRRVASSRKLVSYLSADQIQILKQWSAAIKNGATMPQIREAISKNQSFMHLK